jgi:hypothetical protein
MNGTVEILAYLVGQHSELLSSRDQEGSVHLHLACRRGASFAIVQFLANRYGTSVKSVTPQVGMPLFLEYEMPATSLDTIFLLVKLYPEVVCCLPVVSIAKTIGEDIFSDTVLEKAQSSRASCLLRERRSSNRSKR